MQFSTLPLALIHLLLTGLYARSVVLRMQPGWARVAACLPHLWARLFIIAPIKQHVGPLPYLYAYFFQGLAGSKVVLCYEHSQKLLSHGYSSSAPRTA